MADKKLFGLFNRGSKASTPVQNMIGRVVYVITGKFPGQNTNVKNIDQTIPDYRFWDRFRNCLIPGYEIAGIYAKGLIEIISSWVISRAVTMKLAKTEDARMVKKVEYTNDILRRFFLANQGDILQLYEDLLALGDQYVVVNTDNSLVYPSPDTVIVDYDPLDYQKKKSITIVTQTDDVRIEDKYTDTVRTVTTKKGATTSVETFKVLIGRIPIVHFANEMSRNEQHGHPIYETLKQLLSEYNDTMKKGLQGAKVAGNPIPVMENLSDPDETIERLSTAEDETYTDKDGNEEIRRTVKWDEQALIVLGEGGRFIFAAPPVGFSKDILDMLKTLFDIIVKRFHTPEHFWGVGTNIGKGVEEQFPMWVRFIEGRRDKFAGKASDPVLKTEAQGGLYELADIWLRTRALTDNKVFVGATVIVWSDLTERDKQLTFDWVKYLVSRGAMRMVTALEKSGLVENPEDEYVLAQEEMKTAMMENGGIFPDLQANSNDIPAPGTPRTESGGTPDMRGNSGSDAPRMPAFGGGGKTQ